MHVRLLSLWEYLRSSYWFVPFIMALYSMALAGIMLQLDINFADVVTEHLPWVYEGGPEGARELLSTVASAAINVGGIVFSISIATLTLASQQYGPRLLRNFMRDTGNQVTLGTFVATFLYCLIILRTVKSEDNEFVPQLSVTLGLVLAVFSIAVLIYYIHHIAMSIQASYVVSEVGYELDATIERLFPETLGESEPHVSLSLSVQGIPDGFERDARPVLAEHDGYLQGIDTADLLHLAVRHDLLVRFLVRPGHFVNQGSQIALIWPPQQFNDDLAHAINSTLTIGRRRTPLQDIEYGIDQLVEVAVRALSPSVNDPFTAIMCVDWLGATLARLARRRVPLPYRADEAGRLRVIVQNESYSGVINNGFDKLRQNARGNVAVTIRLLEAIALVGEQMRDPAGRAALRRQAIMIERASRESVPEEWDRNDIRQRYELALRMLAEEPEQAARLSMERFH